MRNVFTIDADLKKKMYILEPTVTQNDDITFIINVLDNGAPFSLTGVTTASLANTRIDGKTVVTPGTIIDGNTIQFDLGTNETAVPGKVLATVQLYDEDERVSTIAFTYRVVKDPTGYGYIPSEREQTLIETVLGDGPLVIQQSRDAANAASEAAANANEAATIANNAAASANEAADNANLAAERANNEANYAKAQGDYAKSQAELIDDVLDQGPVVAVNGKTGNVILTAEDVNAVTISDFTQLQQTVTSQLAETAKKSEVNYLATHKADIDYVENFKNSVGASLAAIIAKYELEPMPDPIIKENLWNPNEIELGNLSMTTGNVIESSSIYVNDFQSVQENTPYTYSVGDLYQATAFTWKVAYYDENKNFISGLEFTNVQPNTHSTHITPPGTKFIRVCVSRAAKDTFAIVVGEEPYNPEDEGVIYDGGFWEDVPTPPLKDKSVNSLHIKEGAIKEEHLDESLLSKINDRNRKYPNPPLMDFEVISNLADIPYWLDKEGETIYAVNFFQLKQTTDEWETLQNIGQPFDEQVRGIRLLRDGQLLVSTGRNQSKGVKAAVWKSENYDKNNPEKTTFRKVHEAVGEAADFYNHWGMDVYENIVLLSEYGTKDGTGARRAYLSEDDGETFREIFWQESVYAELGIPYSEDSAHVHTIKYDPYFQRIWIVCGDGINTGTFYSDDLGNSWKVVEGSTGLKAVQYTGIAVLPDCVVFGSDRSPNGLHIWERTLSRADKVIIKPWCIINDYEVTSHIFQMAFQRKIGEPYYFGSFWDQRAGEGKSVIMSFVDKHSVQVVYEVPVLYDETIGNLGAQHVIGATKNGYVYTAYYDGSSWNVARAKAPTWEKV